MVPWPADFVVLYLLSMTSGGLTKKLVSSPPTIFQHPSLEITFKAGEKVEIPCRATGEPSPSYTWKKNDQPLMISNIDIKQLHGIGTIVINEPVSSYEGVYQCIATNNLGSALSIKSVVRKAVQEPFPSIKDPKIHRPVVGMPLILHCQPPLSYPQGLIYWGENREGSRLKPIENSARISLDYEGNLYFAHVLEEDARGGVSYICIVQNTELRSLVQGDDQKIDPRSISGRPKNQPPKLMWPVSSSNEVALKGQAKKMKCIFSGYPTPIINWTLEGAPLPSKVVSNSFGQEITIPDVDSLDMGIYKCIGKNIVSEESRTVTLQVESRPFWKNDKSPEDVNTSEEESARFDCQAEGQPKPDIVWLINGVPIEDLPADSRRSVGRDYLIYRNVTNADAQVIQCNASNKHGYIFANAFLNVLAQPPSFIETPQSVVRVAEGQNITLTCQVFGAPKPIITWKKASTSSISNSKAVSGDRFIAESSGNLRILNVETEDHGTYFCSVLNKFGSEEASGELLVRSKTMIVEAPVPHTVNESADFTFRCRATTDPEEKNKLKIDWLKNGQKIDYEREGSISKNLADNSLKITQAQVSDTGNYTCNASNGLDFHAVTIKFTVKGRPDPPQDVRLISCTPDFADVEWSGGKDNNDPITAYVVFYNTSFEPEKYYEMSTVPKGKLSTRIKLLPWTNYTFHVKARNKLGLSECSNFTQSVCSTPSSLPSRHPYKVCTTTEAPNQLVIVWEPMLRNEHNGEDFHYVVTYKLRNIPNAVEEKKIISEWQQNRLIVENQETFQEYEIYVQAENKIGLASSSQLKKIIGFSGQDIPLDKPQNFHINTSTLNSTSVEFLWSPVDKSPRRIRGFFRGYQLRFWKSDDPNNPVIEDIILQSWNPCPYLSSTQFRRSTFDESEEPVRTHTNRLWPFAQITAGVLVLNAGTSGHLSETIDFITPEGVPSVVRNFHVVEKGSHHMKLAWNKPAESNGILRGYVIEYRKAPPAIDFTKSLKVMNHEQTHKKVHSLQNDTKYIFYIFALTIGRSPPTHIEESTLPSSAPSQPLIANIAVEENFVNVSWVPVSEVNQPPHNPGSMFIVEYRRKGSDDWETTEPENEHNWMNVSNLEEGAIYEFRVVAKNTGGGETRSELETITFRTEAAGKSSVASEGWFIGLMCAIAFLLLILLLICLIKRNRGGKYAVHEKEKLRGHDSTREDDEAGFGEYTRTPHLELKYSEDLNKSRGSLESEEKPLDSESDSLGEYEDPDPSKFNEDGSFIGQYGGKKKSGERLDHDATTPSALSTFV